MGADHEKERERYFAELEALEHAVDEPVIPGEVAAWCESVQRHLHAVGEATPCEAHAAARRLILDANLELAAVVERLDAAARRLESERRRAAAKLTRLLADAEERSSCDEPRGGAEELRETLLSWIAHARAHERELERWVLEATLRDTGVHD